NVVWHTASDLPDSETCVGVDAVQQMLAIGWGTVADGSCRAEEIVDVGDRVAVRWTGRGKGRGSGIPIEWHEAHLYAVRDGRVVEVHEFRDWDEARRAAGAEG